MLYKASVCYYKTNWGCTVKYISYCTLQLEMFENIVLER